MSAELIDVSIVRVWISQKRWIQENPMVVFESEQGNTKKQNLLVYTIAPLLGSKELLIRYTEKNFTQEALKILQTHLHRE